jgi:DNA-directed RNA polymerase subunit RPC12/RpoP
MDDYTCLKCGEELDLDDVENWSKRACPECSEPIPQDVLTRHEEGKWA